MVKYLLDTNVISELQRKNPHPNVLNWYNSVAAEAIYLSAVTLGEIRSGIEQARMHQPERAATLEVWLERLQRFYHHRILHFSAEIADVWGRLIAQHRQHLIDAQLAATALHHGLVLVTRNRKDMWQHGVVILNPWSED